MKYLVNWLPQAENDLAWAYLASKPLGLADAVVASQNDIDRRLEHDPLECSESRDSLDARIVISNPLSMYFLVAESTREVFVYRVVFAPKRSQR